MAETYRKFKQKMDGTLPTLSEKIERDAFLYFNHFPKSPEDEFAQCSTCRMFVPGEKIGVKGDRCIAHGSTPVVQESGSCGVYLVWPKGTPNPEVIANHAAELKKGIPGSVTFEQSGYVNRKVRCENCEFFDDEESDCELYKHVNKELPELFDLDPKVEQYGCCNANTAIEK